MTLTMCNFTRGYGHGPVGFVGLRWGSPDDGYLSGQGARDITGPEGMSGYCRSVRLSVLEMIRHEEPIPCHTGTVNYFSAYNPEKWDAPLERAMIW